MAMVLKGFLTPTNVLVWLEKLLVNSPWPLVILVLAGLAWIGSRNLKLVAGTIACF